MTDQALWLKTSTIATMFGAVILLAHQLKRKFSFSRRVELAFALKPWRELHDLDCLLDAMKDGSIAANTLQIPYPYTRQDAEWYLNMAKDLKLSWFIDVNGKFGGAIGFHEVEGPGRNHIYMLGYYLAPQFRGMGLMTSVLDRAIEQFKRELPNIQYLEANIFAHNNQSGRVLEKNGFVSSNVLKFFYSKNGQVIDAVRYVRKLY